MPSRLPQCRAEDISPSDILIGKGKKCTNHVGTIAFKAFVGLRVPEYMNCISGTSDRTIMTRTIVHDIVHEHGGRFLQQTGRFNSGVWVELNQNDAREKVRYCFREAVESRRKVRPRALLAKVPISVNIDKEDTFGDLLNKLSNDPAVNRFLATSKETTLKEENGSNKYRQSKTVTANRPRPFVSLPSPSHHVPSGGFQEETVFHDTACKEGTAALPHLKHCTHATENDAKQAFSVDDSLLAPIDPWKEDGFEVCSPDMGEELLKVLAQVGSPTFGCNVLS